MSDATPRPWAKSRFNERAIIILCDGFRRVVVEFPSAKDADFALNAVNAYDDMLAALKKITNNWNDLHPKDLQQARSAIAKAEGK